MQIYVHDYSAVFLIRMVETVYVLEQWWEGRYRFYRLHCMSAQFTWDHCMDVVRRSYLLPIRHREQFPYAIDLLIFWLKSHCAMCMAIYAWTRLCH